MPQKNLVCLCDSPLCEEYVRVCNSAVCACVYVVCQATNPMRNNEFTSVWAVSTHTNTTAIQAFTQTNVHTSKIEAKRDAREEQAGSSVRLKPIKPTNFKCTYISFCVLFVCSRFFGLGSNQQQIQRDRKINCDKFESCSKFFFFKMGNHIQ